MSLDEPYSDDNVFAKILAGGLPSAKVRETDETLAFMDAFPQAEGHTLVIPKAKGVTNFLGAPLEMVTAVTTETQAIAKAVAEALQPDGIRIAQFNGTPAGQTVFHLHFHIIPVWTDRPEKPHSSSPADLNDLNEVAAQIRNALT